eukprot:253238-Hanusia_phi.AAC.1
MSASAMVGGGGSRGLQTGMAVLVSCNERRRGGEGGEEGTDDGGEREQGGKGCQVRQAIWVGRVHAYQYRLHKLQILGWGSLFRWGGWDEVCCDGQE